MGQATGPPRQSVLGNAPRRGGLRPVPTGARGSTQTRLAGHCESADSHRGLESGLSVVPRRRSLAECHLAERAFVLPVSSLRTAGNSVVRAVVRTAAALPALLGLELRVSALELQPRLVARSCLPTSNHARGSNRATPCGATAVCGEAVPVATMGLIPVPQLQVSH